MIDDESTSDDGTSSSDAEASSINAETSSLDDGRYLYCVVTLDEDDPSFSTTGIDGRRRRRRVATYPSVTAYRADGVAVTSS